MNAEQEKAIEKKVREKDVIKNLKKAEEWLRRAEEAAILLAEAESTAPKDVPAKN